MPATPLSDFIPDRVIPATGGDPVELWVHAALPKEEWLPHSPGDLTHAEYPGSAIKYQDRVYELMCVEESVEGGYAFRYGLRAWDPQYIIRHLVNYTLETQREATAAHQDRTKTQGLRSMILWLFPLAGFAPDPLQREWEEKTGLRMAWASAGSALFGMALAFALRGVGKSFDAVIFYLALESFTRLFWTGISRRPHGSFLLTLPYLLWQGLKRMGPPGPAENVGAVHMKRQDEVRRDPGRNSLRISSWYFDTTLAGSTLIGFEGAAYKPFHWHQEGKGLTRRWVYELEKVEPEDGAPRREYTCPRTPDRQKAVEDFTHRLDLAHSFALFWSTYPRQDQLHLQLLYQYDGPGSTAITAGIFLVIGVMQLCITVVRYRGMILALVGPAYLMLESLYRLYRAKVASEPAGSIVGYVLRVLIHAPK